MAASRFAQRDSSRTILRLGLLRRRAELRTGWQRLITVKSIEQLGSNAARVVSVLSGQDAFHDWQPAATMEWQDCDANLPECLISLGVGEGIVSRPSTTKPTVLSCSDFKGLRTKARLETLCARYRYPLNIGIERESEIAEELLRQLMVADRATLEAKAEFEVDDVLLKLSLTGIYARMKHDLRFLDALNYFYELPQRSVARLNHNPYFLAAWLCIYAQLLCAPDW
jgi:hypothetical protein